MADKHFFDRLKAKVSELKPSEKHQNSDWMALEGRLQAALPHQPRQRRRAIVLPFLLLTALLSSNAVWWQSSRNDRAAIIQMAAQVADLQTSISRKDVVPGVIVRVDTVWQTMYVKQWAGIPKESTRSLAATNFKDSRLLALSFPLGTGHSVALDTANSAPKSLVAKEAVSTSEHADSIKQWFNLTNIKLPPAPLVQSSEFVLLKPKTLDISVLKAEKTTEIFGQNLLKSLRPKFLKVGSSAGWLYANSSGLMHEGGFSCNVQGEIGLTRHWSITTAFSMGRVHYKSHTQEAILGTPALPMLPSTDHHFAEMDVTGQKIRQFDLGLCYTFAQPGKPRPFLGIGWGGQTLLPFTIEYEIQHELSGMIEKGVFEVTNRIKMRNIFGLTGGFEIPISPRIDLNMEGFYQRQWKKPNKQAPDLTGIRAGLSWLF